MKEVPRRPWSGRPGRLGCAAAARNKTCLAAFTAATQLLAQPLAFLGRQFAGPAEVFPDALPLLGGQLLPTLWILTDAAPDLGREPTERFQVLADPLPFLRSDLLAALQVLLDAGALLRRQRFGALGHLAHGRVGNGQPDGQHHQQRNAPPPHGSPRSSVSRSPREFTRRSGCWPSTSAGASRAVAFR